MSREGCRRYRAWVAVLLVAAPLLGGCLTDRASPTGEGVLLPEALLLEAPFPRLVVDVDHVEGRKPTPEALAALERELEDVTGKRIVEVEPATPIHVEDDGRDHTWTMRALDALHRRTIDAPSPECCRGWNGTAYLHALFVNGRLPSSEHGAIGKQGGTALYIAQDAVDQLAGSPHPAPSNPRTVQIERSVLIHEAGHALGLVDAGVPMQHPRIPRDDPCRCHSRYETSVMYPRVELLPDLEDVTGEGTWLPYRFDRYDREDLAAFRAARRVP